MYWLSKGFHTLNRFQRRLLIFFAVLGPGIITVFSASRHRAGPLLPEFSSFVLGGLSHSNHEIDVAIQHVEERQELAE